MDNKDLTCFCITYCNNYMFLKEKYLVSLTDKKIPVIRRYKDWFVYEALCFVSFEYLKQTSDHPMGEIWL